VTADAGQPPAVRRAFFKQVGFLEHNLHRPSRHAKKYDEARDIWQARVNRDWRLYFNIIDDTCIIRDIIPPPEPGWC
jgi:plasmid maintenance system killer protein